MTHQTNVSVLLDGDGDAEPTWFDNATVEYKGGFAIISQLVELKMKVQGTDGSVVETNPFKVAKKIAFPVTSVREIHEIPVAVPVKA